MTMSDEDALLQAILGLLDGVSDAGLKRMRARRIATHTTQLIAKDVYALLDVVESVRPGLLDHYSNIRATREADASKGKERK